MSEEKRLLSENKRTSMNNREDTENDQLTDFRRNVNEVFNRVLAGAASSDRAGRFLAAVPPVEAWVNKNEGKYHLSIAIPGVDPKEVQLNLEGNNLTVSGERKGEQGNANAEYTHQEFAQGRFERTIKIPDSVDTGKLTAEYRNGVLEISAPLKSSAIPKRIEINSAAKAKVAGVQ
jgi:HSP20 family protein